MLHRNAGAKLLIFWDMANFFCLFCRNFFKVNENLRHFFRHVYYYSYLCS